MLGSQTLSSSETSTKQKGLLQATKPLRRPFEGLKNFHPYNYSPLAMDMSFIEQHKAGVDAWEDNDTPVLSNGTVREVILPDLETLVALNNQTIKAL